MSDDCSAASRQEVMRAFLDAAAAEVAADEGYNALARMRPAAASRANSRQLEDRYARLIEAKSLAEARAFEILQVLGAADLLDGWLSTVGGDD
jgi:hypothetical protein